MKPVTAATVGALLGIALGAGLVACGGSTDDDTATEKQDAPKDAIVKTTENGPVKATIKVWPPKPTLGDAIQARLEIDAPAGITIDAPFQEAGDQRLGRFTVDGFTKDIQRKPDGGQLVIESYRLYASSSGRQRVPPLRIEMTDQRTADHAAKPQEILTDEVPIEVAPVKAETVEAKLHPALGDLDTDFGGPPWVTIVGLLGAFAVIGSGSLLLLRAIRARRNLAKQRSAYDEAVSKLRGLEDRGAPAGEDADAWFVELSSIVRDYLERRFVIRAPELTTEEFLLVATARPELTLDHRGLLTSFLERCDRVKFAGYRPDADESLATLKAARAFIEDTRLREESTSKAAA
ncbi:MAG TPA: hypothetical protein VGO00_09910 [Kofleriaceae bacterium]|jgi:hypothetical protein|nr:hypothetical protein [Kofleriaceae bacterium]